MRPRSTRSKSSSEGPDDPVRQIPWTAPEPAERPASRTTAGAPASLRWEQLGQAMNARRWAIAGVVFALAAVSFAYIAAGAFGRVPVETAVVQEGIVNKTVTITGRLAALRTAHVTSRRAGAIDEVVLKGRGDGDPGGQQSAAHEQQHGGHQADSQRHCSVVRAGHFSIVRAERRASPDYRGSRSTYPTPRRVCRRRFSPVSILRRR